MSYLNINTQTQNNEKTLSQNTQVRRKRNVEDIYKALKPKGKEYRQPTDIAGLYCRVQQNGKKSWQYRYKTTDGKWRWTGLGSFPAILKKFRQSVLADAVSGKLTEIINFQREDFYDFVDELIKLNKKNKSIEVKEFSEYKSNWKDIPLSLLVDQDRGIPYGIVQTGDDTDGGVNTVRCGDVLPFKVRSSNLKRVDKNIEKNYLRTRLKGGEVILAIRGSVGNAAVVTSDLISEPLNISREVAMIPVISKLDPYYLTIFLQSPNGRQILLEQTRGVAQKGINLDDLRKLYIPLPTLEEQKLIVEKVNTLFGFSNNIEEIVESAQKRVNLLTQSILAKAFSGELTVEWREQHQELIIGVNSAESLLAKIQAEREASKPVKKTRAKKEV